MGDHDDNRHRSALRRAYHLAEGDVLDAWGFIDLFAEDGVFNGIGGVSGQESYRGEQLGDVIVFMGKFLPDVHQQLHRVNVFEFNCHIGVATMFAQLGILPDFTFAVAASTPE